MLMRLGQHRSLRSQVSEIGVRSVDAPVGSEEIVLVKILLLVVHGDSVVELLSAAVVRRGRFSRDVLPGIRQAPADVPAVHPRRKAGGRAGSINKQRCRPKLTSVAWRFDWTLDGCGAMPFETRGRGMAVVRDGDVNTLARQLRAAQMIPIAQIGRAHV